MRSYLVIAACVCALVSCKKKEDAAPAAKPAEAAPLSCAKLVPQAIVDKYIAGKTLHELNARAGHTSCEYKHADAVALLVQFECDDMVKKSMASSVAELGKNQDAASLPGIGAAAFKVDKIHSIQVWDDDTNCHISIVGSDELPDVSAFAKDLTAAVTPSSLP